MIPDNARSGLAVFIEIAIEIGIEIVPDRDT
jgi:hypothetical protein